MLDDHKQFSLPDTVPVMVLGGATLFPNCLLPLFIFEPRYRLMLNHALETDRMLCIGTIRPDSPSDVEIEEVHPLSTIALVRACVTHDDETSHIVLQGVSRVQFNAWPQLNPFRIAEISPVEPAGDEESDQARQMAAELIDLTAKATGDGENINPMLQQHLRGICAPGAIADVVAHLLIKDPAHRQSLLETTGTVERIHELILHMQKVIAQS